MKNIYFLLFVITLTIRCLEKPTEKLDFPISQPPSLPNEPEKKETSYQERLLQLQTQSQAGSSPGAAMLPIASQTGSLAGPMSRLTESSASSEQGQKIFANSQTAFQKFDELLRSPMLTKEDAANFLKSLMMFFQSYLKSNLDYEKDLDKFKDLIEKRIGLYKFIFDEYITDKVALTTKLKELEKELTNKN